MKIVEGLEKGFTQIFFEEINKTSMKRKDFEKFNASYENRDVVLSLWDEHHLVGFGSMLTDWHTNSIIHDVVVTEEYKKQGYGKKIMELLMDKVPDSRFFLTSTFGHEEFYTKLGFKRHINSFALYHDDSPYLK